MNYQIITDSSCDLPSGLVKEKKITVVPFYVSFDNEHYKKEIVEIGIRDFYEQMVQNPKIFPKSSMPSVQDYVDVFEPYAKAGIAIICICITVKFSGSMQSALNARAMILEEYPQARIAVIDSMLDTVLQGQYVLEAVKMQEAGWDFEKTVERLEEIKTSGRIFFTVGDLEYLKHGGRIGKLAGLAGSILGIKPLITLKEGEIFSSGITRNRKKSLDKIVELLLDYLDGLHADPHEYSFSVGFGYDTEEAKPFQEQILAALNRKFPSENPVSEEEIPIFQIGAAISVHTGPYPLGLGVIKKAL